MQIEGIDVTNELEDVCRVEMVKASWRDKGRDEEQSNFKPSIAALASGHPSTCKGMLSCKSNARILLEGYQTDYRMLSITSPCMHAATQAAVIGKLSQPDVVQHELSDRRCIPQTQAVEPVYYATQS